MNRACTVRRFLPGPRVLVMEMLDGLSSQRDEFRSGAVAVDGPEAQGNHSIRLVKRIHEEGFDVGLHFG